MENTKCPYLSGHVDLNDTNNSTLTNYLTMNGHEKCPVLEHFDIISPKILKLQKGHDDVDLTEILKYYYQIESTNMYYLKSNNSDELDDLDDVLLELKRKKKLMESKVRMVDIIPDFGEHFNKIGGGIIILKKGHDDVDLTDVLKYYDKLGSTGMFRINKNKCKKCMGIESEDNMGHLGPNNGDNNLTDMMDAPIETINESEARIIDTVPDFSEHFNKIGGSIITFKKGHEDTDLTEVLKYYDKLGSNGLFHVNIGKCRKNMEQCVL